MINNFLEKGEIPYKMALFISGSGSNAEKILEYHCKKNCKNWIPAVIVTDNPLKSRAVEIANMHNIDCVKLDIRTFYKKRGEDRVSILTESGQRIREEWTNELRSMLKSYKIDFGVLAGFVPLTNITDDFPCLNVHPGDLTVVENERRVLVGLHTVPIEAAILRGHNSLRSSVIIAQPYTGQGGEMDSGPVLGISTPVEVDLFGKNIKQLMRIASERPPKRPLGGYKDELEALASRNQERLKENGDWILFPPVVDDFASGKFALDDKGELVYCDSSGWVNIKTVEYSECSKRLIQA